MNYLPLSTDKTSYAIGDKVKLKLSTAAKDLV